MLFAEKCKQTSFRYLYVLYVQKSLQIYKKFSEFVGVFLEPRVREIWFKAQKMPFWKYFEE